MIIDAKDLIVGRMATDVAKRAMLGEKIDIVNCDKAIMTGRKEDILNKFKARRDRGIPLKGPYYPRPSDRIVRRIIRGMLPYKQDKGKNAFKNIMCYIGIPEKFKGKELTTNPNANVSRLKNMRFLTVGEISKFLGK